MEELIRKSDVVKVIDKKIQNTSDYLQHDALIELEADVEEIPTVEAVPVVRCKKCEHWGTGGAGETKHVKCCEYAKYMVGENGYCCYGADMRTSAE